VSTFNPTGGSGRRAAKRALVLATAMTAIAPLATTATASAATSHRLKFPAHRQVLGSHSSKLGFQLPKHIDSQLLSAKGNVTVMLQLSEKPGLRAYQHPASGATNHDARVSAYHQQVSAIRSQQHSVISKVVADYRNSRVLYAVHAGYNGVAVRTNAANIARLAHIPGVVGIHRIAGLHPVNNATVPLIQAPAVWSGVGGNTGAGTVIGIIDTGIDYTHADFNGPGTVQAYQTALAGDTTPAFNSGEVSYPDPKVAGGIDLAGDAYDALAGQPGDQAGDTNPDDAIPHPDDNPLDCNSHGTHVAGTSAGYGENPDGSTYTGSYSSLDSLTPQQYHSTFKIGPGVAPGAQVFSVKVFGCLEGADSEIVPQAIDYLIQQTLTPTTGHPAINVINMSLGGDFASADDPTGVETNAAVDAGITVVSAAGNAGDQFDVMGSPGNAVKGIGVAASDDTEDVSDGLVVNSGNTTDSTLPGEQSSAFDWANMTDVTGDLATTGDITAPVGEDNNDGCDPISQDLTGKIAYLKWTDNDNTRRCGSATRTGNAEDAGAIGAVFFDDENEFAAGILGNADIPAMLITQDAGAEINDALAAAETVNVTLTNSTHNSIVNPHPDTVNAIADFSSRGIGLAGNVKPDVAAPGMTVFSAGMGSGNDGLSDSGTSMATPHVAGVAALVTAAHPTWSMEQIKAAIMNTATQDVFARKADGTADTATAEAPMRVGAGRVIASKAVDPGTIAWNSDNTDAVSVSFGPVDASAPRTVTKHITVKNVSGATQTYTADYQAVDAMPGASYTVSPSSPFQLADGDTKLLTVTLTIDPSQLVDRPDRTLQLDPLGLGLERSFIADASGDVVVHPDTTPPIRVPVYAAPRPASAISQPGSVKIASGHGSVKLSGPDAFNPSTQPGDAFVASTYDAFELQGTSGKMPLCSTGQTPPGCVQFPDDYAGDLKAVGFASDAAAYNAAGFNPLSADPAGNGAIPPALGYFGISTQGPWRTPASYEEYDVLIDTNGDGSPDADLFETSLGGDVFVSALTDMDGNVLDIELLNNSDGSFETDQFNSDSLTLPFALNALEFAGYNPLHQTRISYWVIAQTEEGGIDTIGASVDDPFTPTHPMSVNPVRPAIRASDTTSGDSCGLSSCFPVLQDDIGGNTVTVQTDNSQLAGDKPLGLLVMHHNNANGKRSQFVKIATTTTLALKKTTMVKGYRDPAVVTVRSGAGVPTGTVKVFNGRHLLATYRLSSGTRSFRLPALAVGRHTITVVYSGDALHASSRTHRTIRVTRT
jgi:subtilisin family serine protease